MIAKSGIFNWRLPAAFNFNRVRSNLIVIVSLGTSSNGASSERDHHDVPYPAPDAFLLPQQPRFEAGEDDDTEDEADDDDDDDAQSIKSYGSDHIRFQSVSMSQYY